MLYDKESGKIKLGLEEFLTISNRGISPTLPFDEDLPHQEEQSLAYLKYISPDIRRDRVVYGFSAGGYDFEIHASVLHVIQTEVIIARETDSNPERLSKAEKELLHAEGMVIAKIMSDLDGVDFMSIVYYVENRDIGRKIEAREHHKNDELTKYFDRCTEQIARYAAPEIDRVTRRLPSFATVKFPYSTVRDGQREFMREAYRSLYYGQVVFAEAPTGTGKTVSALYPALKALAKGRAEKIFYLTPKGTTANAVRDTINDLARGGAMIKSVILSPKERMCIGNHACRTSRSFCRFSSCAKIADAVLKLYDNVNNCLNFKDILAVAKEYSVCPYELSLAYSELCDIVICDFNYLFDPSVYLRRFFEVSGRYIFLVDEAHNLIERSRDMYSAALSVDEIDLSSREDILPENAPLRSVTRRVSNEFYDTLYPHIKDELRETKDGDLVGATHLTEIPLRLYQAADELCVVLDETIREAVRARDIPLASALRDYRYRIKKFHGAMQRFDENYRLIIFLENGKMRVEILALHTGKQVRKMLSRGSGALLFSATLSPINYYKAALGGEGTDKIISVESPFAKEQLAVAIMDKVSTRFSEREDTLSAVCRCIAATVSARRGNYMVFSPSFAYSEALAAAFREKYPKIKTLLQTKSMTSAERAEFIEEFKKTDGGYLIGFAVMGGIYSEGIDLAGDSLIGAVVVGIGIPGLSYEREAIAAFYEEKYEEGKQFAYVYPGMNRVFQAAGRVIRREGDRGVIVLIDDRFDDPIYKKSLPKLWGKVKFISDAKVLKDELLEFWRGVDSEDKV